MIRLGMSDGGSVVIQQWNPRPLVYLDMAPLMDGADHHLDRFAKAILQHPGTLALSAAHLLELAQVGPTTGEAVEGLLRSIWPNIVFLHVEFGAVVDREDEFLATGRRIAPHLHRELAGAYLTARPVRSLDPLDVSGFIEAIRSPTLQASFTEMLKEAAEETEELFAAARGRYDEGDGVATRVKSRPSGVPFPNPTRYVAEEMMKLMVKNRSRLDVSNLKDFWHTVVPISYCDFVVVDKHWAENARQVQTSLRAAGLLTHEARVFPSRHLVECIAAIEGFSRSDADTDLRHGAPTR